MTSWCEGLEDNAIEAVKGIVRDEGFEKGSYEITTTRACEKGDNYMGIVRRINVVGYKRGQGPNDGGETVDWSFVLKTSPSFDRKMPVGFVYERELFAYSQILPILGETERHLPEEDRFEHARLLAGDSTPMKEFIALEDLTRRGFAMAPRLEFLTRAHMALMVRSLARLHAMSFASRRDDPERFARLVEKASSQSEYSERFLAIVEAACAEAVDAMPESSATTKEKLRAFASGVRERLLACVDPAATGGYAVLCHGDCTRNNVMFKARSQDGRPVQVRFVDWQMLKLASPVIDVAYPMFSCTDRELRRQHCDDLLDEYYAELRAHLMRLNVDPDECYPESVFRDHLNRFFRPFGLIMAMLTSPIFACDDEDVMDIAEVMNGEEQLRGKGEGSRRRYEEHIRGVVEDFVDLGFL